RADAGADPHRSDRDGRKYSHSRLRHHLDRRHRIDPRRLSRRDLRRHDRHAGPCIPARPAAASPELCRRFDRGSRALIDAHLSRDGDRSGGAAGGAVSGQPVMKASLNARNAAAMLVVAGLLVLPLYTSLSGNVFALTLFTRIVIFALAAASLNLIMGYGGLINLSNRLQFYDLCLACLLGGLYLIWRIVNSRFGMVVQGLRSNEARMQAIGFPATRYRLVCFVISGTMCGLAGALLANNTDFVSPAAMYWTRSGDLMVMVILGGMGSLFGPVIGAIVYLVLEEFLSQVTEYWAMIMGPLLLLI